MTKYARHKTLAELRKAISAEGWGSLNTALFDKGGSDGVSFTFRVGRVTGNCVYLTHNGKIMGEVKTSKGDEFYSSDLNTHDRCAWFQKLLDVCLVPQSPEAPTVAKKKPARQGERRAA
ncbi:MAG: hypothetical protein V4662_17840 [Verrucomicrobiota bacterium]